MLGRFALVIRRGSPLEGGESRVAGELRRLLQKGRQRRRPRLQTGGGQRLAGSTPLVCCMNIPQRGGRSRRKSHIRHETLQQTFRLFCNRGHKGGAALGNIETHVAGTVLKEVDCECRGDLGIKRAPSYNDGGMRIRCRLIQIMGENLRIGDDGSAVGIHGHLEKRTGALGRLGRKVTNKRNIGRGLECIKRGLERFRLLCRRRQDPAQTDKGIEIKGGRFQRFFNDAESGLPIFRVRNGGGIGLGAQFCIELGQPRKIELVKSAKEGIGYLDSLFYERVETDGGQLGYQSSLRNFR